LKELEIKVLLQTTRLRQRIKLRPEPRLAASVATTGAAAAPAVAPAVIPTGAAAAPAVLPTLSAAAPAVVPTRAAAAPAVVPTGAAAVPGSAGGVAVPGSVAAAGAVVTQGVAVPSESDEPASGGGGVPSRGQSMAISTANVSCGGVFATIVGRPLGHTFAESVLDVGVVRSGGVATVVLSGAVARGRSLAIRNGVGARRSW